MSVLSNGYQLGGLVGSKPDVEFSVKYLLIGGGVNGSTTSPGPVNAGGAGQYISHVPGESNGGGGSAAAARTFLATSISTPTYSVTVGASASASTFSGTENDGTAFNQTAATGSGKQSGDGYDGGSANMPSNQCTKVNFYADSFCASAYTGGGGGASAIGSNQNGGAGVQSSITGTATYYAGGGASTTYDGNTSGTGGSGHTNFGGGGSGAAGQPGALILRYPNTVTISNPGGGLTLSTAADGSDSVTTITAGTGNIKFAPA